MNWLICCWSNLDDQLDEGAKPESCAKEAKWRSCVPYTNVPTCDEHKCRCAKPLAVEDQTHCSTEPRHPVQVAGLHPEQLAERVANMRYDAIVIFLERLGLRFKEDSILDEVRKRPKLAMYGRTMAVGCEAARTGAEMARDISLRSTRRARKERTS